jgi:hypothetical protein
MAVGFGIGIGIAGRNIGRCVSRNEVENVEEEEEERYERYDKLHLC